MNSPAATVKWVPCPACDEMAVPCPDGYCHDCCDAAEHNHRGQFESIYGQLMSAGPLGLSPRQEAALRDLDGVMVVAEHALQGAPVGAGAHSTICALLMDAYAKGAAASSQNRKD